MSHRPASGRLKRTARLIARVRQGDDRETADRRAIANFLAVWQHDRCGRAACARACRCLDPHVRCVIAHRDTIQDTLRALADGLDEPEEGGRRE